MITVACDDGLAERLIDARVRPLVEALQLAAEHARPDRDLGDEASQKSLDRHNEVMGRIDAALKAAGVESP